MTIDADRAADCFAAATDFTVGIEEEFAVLDAQTLDLVPRFEELRDAAAAEDPLLSDGIAGELISSEIEIRSGRGDDLADALARQRELRQRLFALAASRGVALGATGTHPWSDYREQPNIDTEHYHRVVDGLQYVARRNNTFSMHVHVGVRDPHPAVRVCDRLRPVLPALRDPRQLRLVGRLPRVHRPARADELDRRVHAGLVVDPPALHVRHRRGADLRRAVDGPGGRGAGGADRRVRRAGRA